MKLQSTNISSPTQPGTNVIIVVIDLASCTVSDNNMWRALVKIDYQCTKPKWKRLSLNEVVGFNVNRSYIRTCKTHSTIIEQAFSESLQSGCFYAKVYAPRTFS